MPNIYDALVVKGKDTVGQPINVTCEVQQLLGNNRVFRCRYECYRWSNERNGSDWHGGTSKCSGRRSGRIFNKIENGEPVDNLGPVDTSSSLPPPPLMKDPHLASYSFVGLDSRPLL